MKKLGKIALGLALLVGFSSCANKENKNEVYLFKLRFLILHLSAFMLY